jgi:hypothetical protein
VEPKLNLPLKLSAPSLEACVDALTYCMLAAKRGRSSLWGDFPEFATTWLSPPSSPGGEMVAERLP